jgi:hypothetical protein
MLLFYKITQESTDFCPGIKTLEILRKTIHTESTDLVQEGMGMKIHRVVIAVLVLALFVVGCSGRSTLRQWAMSATASTEFSDPDWGAIQATGSPNTFECGDQVTAWASASSFSDEWLRLMYSVPVTPTEVNIHITYHPSQITRVELIDTNGGHHTVHNAQPELKTDCPFVLSIPVTADFQANGVNIIVAQSILQMGWTEIDAVELIGKP